MSTWQDDREMKQNKKKFKDVASVVRWRMEQYCDKVLAVYLFVS
jgi:hypothetical protein